MIIRSLLVEFHLNLLAQLFFLKITFWYYSLNLRITSSEFLNQSLQLNEFSYSTLFDLKSIHKSFLCLEKEVLNNLTKDIYEGRLERPAFGNPSLCIYLAICPYL